MLQTPGPGVSSHNSRLLRKSFTPVPSSTNILPPPSEITTWEIRSCWQWCCLCRSSGTGWRRLPGGIWGSASAGWMSPRPIICSPVCQVFSAHLGDASHITCHPGVHRTLALVQQRFWWPFMAADIRTLTADCTVCAWNKFPHRLPAGLLQSVPISPCTWLHATMDFVTGLPPSQRDPDHCGRVLQGSPLRPPLQATLHIGDHQPADLPHLLTAWHPPGHCAR